MTRRWRALGGGGVGAHRVCCGARVVAAIHAGICHRRTCTTAATSMAAWDPPCPSQARCRVSASCSGAYRFGWGTGCRSEVQLPVPCCSTCMDTHSEAADIMHTWRRGSGGRYWCGRCWWWRCWRIIELHGSATDLSTQTVVAYERSKVAYLVLWVSGTDLVDLQKKNFVKGFSLSGCLFGRSTLDGWLVLCAVDWYVQAHRKTEDTVQNNAVQSFT